MVPERLEVNAPALFVIVEIGVIDNGDGIETTCGTGSLSTDGSERKYAMSPEVRW